MSPEPKQDEDDLAAARVALQRGNELEHRGQHEVEHGDENGWKIIHQKFEEGGLLDKGCLLRGSVEQGKKQAENPSLASFYHKGP